MNILTAFLMLFQLQYPPCWANAKAGEQMYIEWEAPPSSPPGDLVEWRLTRQSSEKGAETLVGVVAWEKRRILFTMPKSSTKRYWLRVRPVLRLEDGSQNVGAASEECIVNRVK